MNFSIFRGVIENGSLTVFFKQSIKLDIATIEFMQISYLIAKRGLFIIIMTKTKDSRLYLKLILNNFPYDDNTTSPGDYQPSEIKDHLWSCSIHS